MRPPTPETTRTDTPVPSATPFRSNRETPGFGVEAVWEGRRVTLGRPARPAADSALATELAIEGAAAIIIRFADALRPDVAEAIAALEGAGVAQIGRAHV